MFRIDTIVEAHSSLVALNLNCDKIFDVLIQSTKKVEIGHLLITFQYPKSYTMFDSTFQNRFFLKFNFGPRFRLLYAQYRFFQF